MNRQVSSTIVHNKYLKLQKTIGDMLVKPQQCPQMRQRFGQLLPDNVNQ